VPSLIQLSDEAIDALISEPKVAPNTLFPLRLNEHNKHRRKDYPVTSATGSGNEFVIAIRQSTFDVMNFSAILMYRRPGLNTVFRLRRYNGKHGHTNQIEGTTLNDFHIHKATERYQQLGAKEDSFAEVTTRHCDLDSAIRRLLEDCGFALPPDGPQGAFVFPGATQ
jgi:hypothetical protein